MLGEAGGFFDVIDIHAGPWRPAGGDNRVAIVPCLSVASKVAPWRRK